MISLLHSNGLPQESVWHIWITSDTLGILTGGYAKTLIDILRIMTQQLCGSSFAFRSGEDRETSGQRADWVRHSPRLDVLPFCLLRCISLSLSKWEHINLLSTIILSLQLKQGGSAGKFDDRARPGIFSQAVLFGVHSILEYPWAAGV